MHNYRMLGRTGEGTFSEVLRCQCLADSKYYACKKMKQRYDSIDQVNKIREIQALRKLNPHPNIIGLKEVIFDPRTGVLALIFELMEMNIYELIKDRRTYLSESRVKLYMWQLIKSLYHMHRHGIFHRDVKPENILLKKDVLKLADYGSCRSMYSRQPYTEYISTRWYRAPECLLTDGYYSHKMDLWSAGCVLYEIMTLRPLFPGSNELDQISRIHDVLGTPSSGVLDKFRVHQSRCMNFNFPPKSGTGLSSLFKSISPTCLDLLSKLCTYDPDERISGKTALWHPYFKDFREAEERARVGKSPAVDERQSSVYPRRRHYHRSHRSHHGYSGTVSHMASESTKLPPILPEASKPALSLHNRASAKMFPAVTQHHQHQQKQQRTHHKRQEGSTFYLPALGKHNSHPEL
ncbi:MAPK/MAK/MRK overlapping kinase-like [Dysidea avara]|uniref:MAPK/MAK/MRK overlapping kinase-like n=1 Tax=Dysidea avara TaxID=196820 RepID=UPI003326AC58